MAGLRAWHYGVTHGENGRSPIPLAASDARSIERIYTMETPIIIAIILLIVLIAGGIYMLTRNPAPPRSDGPHPSDSPEGVDPEVDRYDVGGEHVAAGDAEASTVESPYDQDSNSGHTVYEHDGETHVEPATVDETVSQDTATGTEVEIVEEEPVVRPTEDLDPVDAPADPYDHGDQEQVTYGTARTEDYAAETTYAQPVPHEQDLDKDEEPSTDEDAIVVVEEDEPSTDEDAIVVVEEDEPSTDEDAIVVVEEDEPSTDEDAIVVVEEDEPSTDEDADVVVAEEEVLVAEPAESEHLDDDDDDDLSGRTAEELIGGATVMGKAGDDDVRESGDSDARTQEYHSGDHHGEASENLGPEEGEGDVDEHEADQGHPGPSSQGGGDATYAGPLTHGEGVENLGPERGEGDQAPPSDQGHPGHDSHPGAEATYDLDDGVTDGSERDTDPNPEVGETVAVEELDDSGEGATEVQLVDPEDYPVATSGELRHDGHTEDREDTDLHHHAAEDDADHHLVDDHEQSEQSEQHERTADHDNGEDHRHVQDVGSVDVDDYAADEMAPERQAGLDSDESTSAMVDLENEEPVATSSDADTHVDSRESAASGPGATAAGAAEEGSLEDGAAGSRTDAAAHSEDADTGSHDVPLAQETDDGESVPEEGPYGPGSAMPHDDGTGPSGFEVKGNAGSMLFHTPDSPAYEDCRAEVWFDSEGAAREAGFAHWDRKRR